MIRSSIHPWYYIPGRKDLTEKLISRKREKEARHAETWKNNADYFTKCNTQSKIHHKWEDDKSLLKYAPSKKEISKPPFDVEEEKKTVTKKKGKQVEAQYKDSCRSLSQLMDRNKRLQKESDKLHANEQILTTQLGQLNASKDDMFLKRECWTLKEKRLFYVRFGRDKLRQKAFLICNQLNYYKMTIEFLQDMNIGHDILCEDELTQIAQVNDHALQIIDMYLQLNYNRNSQFTLLFHEEGEKKWLIQDSEWDEEKEVWETLMDKLMESYQNILVDKLRENVENQEVFLHEREENLSELSSLLHQIKRNTALFDVFDEEMSLSGSMQIN